MHVFFFAHKNIIFDKITAILTLTFQTFFFVIIITVQICKFNINVSTQFLLLYYFITPYDAQASSALIF